MSKYRIILNGKTYEMEVELVSGNEDNHLVEKGNATTEIAPMDKTIINNKEINNESKRTYIRTGSVEAPMPGNICCIEKSVGTKVKTGDLVLILEAMKMENEITAPIDGKIIRMNCQVGDAVASGEILFEIG